MSTPISFACTHRCWEEMAVGSPLPELQFPLTVYRLVMAAGSNRDFTAIHHNSDIARAGGAPDMYANTLLLQGMWERAVREHIGLAGRIHQLRGFRMSHFNCVGDTVTVRGHVLRVWSDTPPPEVPDTDGLPSLSDRGWVQIQLQSENRYGVSVGPGYVIASLPYRP